MNYKANIALFILLNFFFLNTADADIQKLFPDNLGLAGQDFLGPYAGHSSQSSNGRYLVVTKVNESGVRQVYWYDRMNPEELRLVSRNVAGGHGNGESRAPAISGNGMYVAFFSKATDLISGDTNESEDLFLYDVNNDSVKRINTKLDGSFVNGLYGVPSVSDDGHYVGFSGIASDFDPTFQAVYSVFLKDTIDNTLSLVSTLFNSDQPFGSSASPYLSSNGRIIAFGGFGHPAGFVDNLDSGWGNFDHSFWIKLDTGERRWVNKPTNSQAWQIGSRTLDISSDGRYVLFDSKPSNFVEDPLSLYGVNNVWLYDSVTETVQLVSETLNGKPVDTIHYTTGKAVSEDGRFVVFASASPNIVENDTNGYSDIFIRDMRQGITLRISKSTNGGDAEGSSVEASMSSDGRNIFFSSTAANLIEGQAEGSFSSYAASNPFLFNGRIDSENSPERVKVDQEIIDSGRKAVVLVHGWNSNATAGMIQMADEICQRLGVAPNPGEPNTIGVRCSGGEWDIWYVDWRYMAGDTIFGSVPAVLAKSAWENAQYIGEILGNKFKNYGYEHIHFIAHSAGSRVIDEAKNTLFELPRSDRPTIHMTFLDAYDPESGRVEIDGKVYGMSTYGGGANWVDSYLDTREVAADAIGLIDTNLLFTSAFNVDVSKLDNEISLVGLRSHEWPVEFYQKTLEEIAPSYPSFGFGYSDESEAFTSPATSESISLATLKANRNKLCIVDKNNPTNCENGLAYSVSESYAPTTSFRIFLDRAESATGACADIAGPLSMLYPGLQQVKTACGLARTATGLWGWAVDSAINHELCDASLIDTLAGNNCFSVQLSAIASPAEAAHAPAALQAKASTVSSYEPGPARIEYEFTTNDQVNNLSFDYHFEGGGEGLLSVWIDENDVRWVDQRYVSGATQSIRDVYIGDLLPGTHKLGFRLDAYSDSTPSNIQVSNINLGKSEFTLDEDKDSISDSSDNCPTIANFDQQNTDGDRQGNVCDEDDDNDLMTDDWEKAHGFDPENRADAALDPDADGYSNLVEFLGGGDPRDANSMPVFEFPALTLPSNIWKMISLPGDPRSLNTVSSIFGEFLDPADYDTSWVLFGYTPGAGYYNVGLNGHLVPGVGYWMLQITGTDVEIRIPEVSIPAVASKPWGCESAQGCHLQTLAATDQIRWNMVGNPTGDNVLFDSLKIQTDSGVCVEGCSLDAAQAANYAHNQMWTYPGSGAYQLLESGGVLRPWEGAWYPALPDSAGRNPQLLVPLR